MGDFETAGLDARMKHLDYKFAQERQVMASKWDADMRALKSKLQVEVMRGRMHPNEAQAQAQQFAQRQRVAAQEFMSKYEVEKDRLNTFYQPAEEPMTADPVKQYKGLLSEKDAYEKELGEFVQAPGGTSQAPVARIFKRGKVPFSAGALKVKDYDLIPDNKGGLKKQMKLRDASKEEMQRWAAAQAGLEDVNRRLSQVRTNKHVSARTNRSAFDPMGGGTFGQKIEESKPKPKQEASRARQMDFTALSDEELERIAAGG